MHPSTLSGGSGKPGRNCSKNSNSFLPSKLSLLPRWFGKNSKHPTVSFRSAKRDSAGTYGETTFGRDPGSRGQSQGPRSQRSARGSLTMKSKAAQWKPGKQRKRENCDAISWLERGEALKNHGDLGEVVVKEIYGTAVKSIFDDLPATSLHRSCSFPHPPVLVVASAAPMVERGSKRSH